MHVSSPMNCTDLSADELVRNVQLIEVFQLTDDLLVLEKRRTLLFQFSQRRCNLFLQYLQPAMHQLITSLFLSLSFQLNKFLHSSWGNVVMTLFSLQTCYTLVTG